MTMSDIPGIDTTIANVARIYDYLLGGKDNFEADRAAAARIMELIPGSAQCRLACWRVDRGFGVPADGASGLVHDRWS
jgi:hypothetical protein